MKTIMMTVAGCLLLTAATGQNKKKQDIEAIKAMCGCFDVNFNFAETFAAEKDYEFHDNYSSGALEYVFPVEETKDKIVLQHLLVIGDTMIIKHWRQDWIYENTDLYTYHKDNTWKYESIENGNVNGQWTQKVYQVDDGPRYEGTATWIHADGRHYWESTANAPLPRREFSKRDDYNVMVRRNRQEILDSGWIHEQDNDKVVRTEKGDKLLAREKGLNTYEKVEESKCQIAKDWWSEHKNYWADVRAVWDELFASKQTISIKKKVDGKVLFMDLFALQDELLKGNYHSEKAKEGIRSTIQKFLESDQKLISALN